MTNKGHVLIVCTILGTMWSCGSKKVITEYKEIQKIDTVYKTSVKEIVKAYHDTINIEAPCDSLGHLKPFKQVIHTPKANITLSNQNGNISLKINLDSMVNAKVNEFKSNYKVKTEIKTKKIIRYLPPMWAWYSLIANVLLLGFIFRNKIPFLKWLPF